MDKKDINKFIKERRKHNEEWKPNEVEEAYGEDSLEDALNSCDELNKKYNMDKIAKQVFKEAGLL